MTMKNAYLNAHLNDYEIYKKLDKDPLGRLRSQSTLKNEKFNNSFLLVHGVTIQL